MEHNIKSLEGSLGSLKDALNDLGDGADIAELLRIIHKPGWTTPAEYAFAVGITESLTAQVKQVAALKATLVKAAAQVGEVREA